MSRGSSVRQRMRLADGGRIDRARPLSFRFNGRELQGFAGDSVASALLANGISVVGRSFKYHRPRGIVASGAEEPNAIVQVGEGAHSTPGLRATQVELCEGMVVRSGKGWPSVDFDLLAISDWFSGLLKAGFYYKTFMRPRRLWGKYERIIRMAAGLGTAPDGPDPDRYEHRNAHCDVLVAGAGPAGLMAALAAGRAGARVIVADEQCEFGGSLLGGRERIDGQPAVDWVAEVCAQLDACPEVIRLPRSTVFGYFDHNFLSIAQCCNEHPGAPADEDVRQRLWRVRARRVVLAQGAFERPLVFANNDRPGVMLASALANYARRYALRPGKRAVVFTNNDSAYEAALSMHEAGIEIAAVVDARPEIPEVAASLQDLGVEILPGHAVVDVGGRKRISSARIAALGPDGRASDGALRQIACDLLAMSGGWNPAVHLHSQAGGRNRWDETWHCFRPGASVQANASAGACNASFALRECLAEGLAAGHEAVGECGFETADILTPQVDATSARPPMPLWRVTKASGDGGTARQFVDYQNDTSVADIQLAVREGYRNVEHVKRYTAMGFGTDQGKLGNINGMAIVAECLGVPVASVGTTTYRPAYTPVTFGMCAGADVGDLYEPVRKTAMHEWHEQAAAEFETVGQWLRPWYYPRDGEDIRAAVARECLATRNSLGIMDASTLGKIEVSGPDAVDFLQMMYTHDVAAMKQGRCAYGILLGEDGMVLDDGVMARRDEQRFYLTTTTGGAARVLGWHERWLQTEWPNMRVHLTSVTDAISTIAVVGPNARRLLQGLDCDIALEQSDFPFMSMRAGTLDGFDVELFRVSFSGELAFEINIQSDYAVALWARLMAAGEAYDITPYGTETMHVLRAEKGFVIVGQDTDGSVNPNDLGLGWLLAADKDYLGKRSLTRSDSLRADRKQLVGLTSDDGRTVVPEGAHLSADPAAPVPTPFCGHVSSSYFSTCLDQPIALALLAAGRQRHGEHLYAVVRDGKRIPVTVVSPVFYDRKGERQRV